MHDTALLDFAAATTTAVMKARSQAADVIAAGVLSFITFSRQKRS